MAWYRLAFLPAVIQDLAGVDQPMAQRLFDKTKWIASNADNLRHQAIGPDFPDLCKYAVGEWRLFYSIDRTDHTVEIHHIAHRTAI
jgi:mRNA interferase RelE/StbE